MRQLLHQRVVVGAHHLHQQLGHVHDEADVAVALVVDEGVEAVLAVGGDAEHAALGAEGLRQRLGAGVDVDRADRAAILQEVRGERVLEEGLAAADGPDADHHGPPADEAAVVEGAAVAAEGG